MTSQTSTLSESEVFPKVYALNVFVLQDFCWRTVRDQVSLAHDVGPLTHGQRFADVMIGNQHAETAVTQMLNNALDIDNGDGVNTSKRFIQQDKFWIGGQRAGDFHTATFPPESD